MKPPSITTKITLWVTALVTGLLAVSAFVAFWYFEGELKKAIHLQQGGMVSLVAGELDDKISMYLRELAAVARAVPSGAAADAAAAGRFLASRGDAQLMFDNGMYLFSDSGVLIAGTRADREMIGADYSFREYFRKTVSSGKPQISAPFRSTQSHHHPIVMFTAPVFDAEGRLTAVLAGSLDLLGTNFLGKIASFTVGPDGHLYLFDRHRRFIVHHDPSRVLEADATAGTDVSLYWGTEEAARSMEAPDASGVRCLVSVRALTSVPWVLGASYPVSSAYRPIEQARGVFQLALIPALLLSALLVRLSVKGVTSRLFTFTRHVDALTADPSATTPLPVKGGDEIATLARAFNRMIDERGDLERRQREQRDFFESLLQNTVVPIFVIDSAHRVLIWNRACEELTGIMSRDILGTDRHWSAFYPTPRPCLADLVVEGRESELPALYDTHSTSTLVREGVQAERWVTPADGSPCRYLLFDAAPIRGGSGEIMAAIQTLQDITLRRDAEEKLRRYADELRSINGELRSFSYIVSHDLRAPLVNIRGFSGELRFATKELAALVPQLPHPQRDVLERTLQGEVAEALEFIESSVTRMDNLINAILRFSRIGRRELKPGTVDAGTVVREVLKSLSHRIERGGTRVQVGELPAVTSDPTAFEQVMGNLLDNAVKYLDPSRPGVITVTAEQGEGEVVFRVADNGRGIAEADLEKVFEIFRRAGRQDVPGEGMGLAYVKALVRRQGGRIWVESVPEQGSVFSFSVPAAPVELQAA